ncbi:MAG: hypothetical protein JWO76_1623 [Nocardioides sp.]|nr:hypothetical protein [Nocardioides sp.]
MRQLTDHHILPIRNAYAASGYAMVITELARHGTIEDRINAEPLGLDPLQAVRWTRQACQGIARAHDSGLVHNDIKPGNLFLTEREDCRVGDFGMAGRLDPATGIAPVYGGTFTTLAPEVAAAWSSGPQATPASDVYSLAATAFWMITGQTPHDLSGFSTEAEVLAHLSSVPTRKVRDVAPHVPDTIARVIDRSLSIDPADRPATAHQLSADLGRTIAGRRWRRTDEHTGHLACWRGTPSGNGSVYLLCMEQGKRAPQRVLTATHTNSGHKITKGCAPATRSNWPGVVRRLMRQLV